LHLVVAEGPVDRHVIKGTLFRRRGIRVTFTEEPPVPEVKREPTRRPAMVARMLALAHHHQGRAVRQGETSGLFARPSEVKLVTLSRLSRSLAPVRGLGSEPICR
jgi:hypothetical protein